MSTHTPGPWRVGPFEGHVSAGDRLVAGCMGLYDGKDATRDENIANARLVAAAPDLLDACQEAASLLYTYCDDALPHIDAALRQIQAAIVKAQGR